MPKEFNIDDYQYTEERITLSDWLQAYKPQPNEINHEARFSGLLYEHDGAEWEYVSSQFNQSQWTMCRADDGKLYVKNGLSVNGKVGYFVCMNMHNSHATVIVTDIPEAALEHRICGI